MAVRDDEVAARTERARAIGLFRYQLIREAADPGLSSRARGRLVREIAAAEHTDPAGRRVRVSRDTLDRWIRAWRRGGFDALVPDPRQSGPRLPVEVIEMAVALKRENPARTATQVRRILRAQMGWAPGERTLQRHFADDPQIAALLAALAAGGPGAALGAGAVFGRFEADRPNELWTGDALHGPTIGGRKTYLFAFLDDHSRAIVGHRFGFSEDTVRLAAALRPALASRGVPDGIYVDNGSAFVDAWLLRACAKLGIRLVHSTPGRPQGRGKIERFFRTVREQFLVEITGEPAAEAASGDGGQGRHLVGDLDELNRLFTAWVETVYHRRVHSETGHPPLTRWHAGGPFPLPAPAALAEAFLWEAHRTVSKTALVSLQGNTYQVDPLLVGHRVELVFDPFDLTTIQVRVRGVPAGTAIPHRIGRHAHVKARPETPPEAPTSTGIDYARLVGDAHHTELAKGVNYAALAGATLTVPAGELPGQLDLLPDLDVPDLDVPDLDVPDLDVPDLDVAPGEGAS
jgi:putative transposase